MDTSADAARAILAASPGAGIRFRQGAVVSVQADGTVTLTIGGSTTQIAGVHCLSSIRPAAGESVWLASSGNDFFVIGTMNPDTWHSVGGTGEPAFANSWVNLGGGYQTAQFRRDADGQVYLRGWIKSGTVDTTAFTLPAGYRPAATEGFAALSLDVTIGVVGRVDVTAAGAVVPTSPSRSDWVSLSTVRFHTR